MFSLREKVAAYSPTDEGHCRGCIEAALSKNIGPHPAFGHLLPEGEGFSEPLA